MRLDRAAMILRRVLGIGLSWALVWFVFWALIRIPDAESISLGKVVRGLGFTGLLLGIPFGVAHEVAARGRRASEFTLTRTLVCAFLACAFEQILFLGYLEYRDRGLGLGLGTIVWLALGGCVFGQFVTLAWYAAVRGVARALAPTVTLARLQLGPMALLVVIDFVVILLACWLGNATTFFDHPSVWEYSGSILLTAAVTLVCFYGCEMYHPPRRVGREQVLAIALTTAISFLVEFLLLAMLQATSPVPGSLPGGSLLAFPYMFALTVASRLAWCGVMGRMRRHSVG